MQFLADENVPLPSIRLLREAGLDIEAIGETAPGAPDVQVLSRAVTNGQLLITFDRDFGELIYRRGAPVPPGVIYVRVAANLSGGACAASAGLARDAGDRVARSLHGAGARTCTPAPTAAHHVAAQTVRSGTFVDSGEEQAAPPAPCGPAES